MMNVNIGPPAGREDEEDQRTGQEASREHPRGAAGFWESLDWPDQHYKWKNGPTITNSNESFQDRNVFIFKYKMLEVKRVP